MKTIIEASRKACALIRDKHLSETHPDPSVYDDKYIIRNYTEEWQMFMKGFEFATEDITQVGDWFEESFVDSKGKEIKLNGLEAIVTQCNIDGTYCISMRNKPQEYFNVTNLKGKVDQIAILERAAELPLELWPKNE